MKIVRDFVEERDAIAFSVKLRERGIPTHVGVFKSNNVSFYSSDGPRTYGVWVLDDTQHRDAVLLTKCSRYKVENPMTEEQVARLEEEISRKNIRVVVRDLIIFLACFLGVVTLLAVV